MQTLKLMWQYLEISYMIGFYSNDPDDHMSKTAYEALSSIVQTQLFMRMENSRVHYMVWISIMFVTAVVYSSLSFVGLAIYSAETTVRALIRH